MRKFYVLLISVVMAGMANAQTITSAGTGPWSVPGTWVGGVVPTSINDVVIAATHTVTLDGDFACKSVNVNGTGGLNVPTNTLTVGTAGGDNKVFTVGGTLNISGGTVSHNGNMIISAGSTFSMSSGNLNIDGNGGTAPTSVASGTSLMQILSSLGTVSSGTITIVDPHFNGTGKSIDYSVAATQLTWVGNTLILGGVSGTNLSFGTEGFHLDCFTSGGRLLLGHVTANGGAGFNRIAKTATATGNGTFIGGDLTINAGSEFRNDAATNFWVASNITNNGIYTGVGTLTLQTVVANVAAASPNVQTISGTGLFRSNVNNPQGSLVGLSINNSNITGVTFNAPANLTVLGVTTITTGTVAFNNTTVTFVGTYTNTAATSLPTFAGDVIFASTFTHTNGTETFNGNATFVSTATVTAVGAAGGLVIAAGKTITANGGAGLITTLSAAKSITGAGNFIATSVTALTIGGAGPAIESGNILATIQNTGTITLNNLTYILNGLSGQSTGLGFPTALPVGSIVTMSTTAGTLLTQSTTFNNLTTTTVGFNIPVGVVCTVGSATAGALLLPSLVGAASVAGTLTANFTATCLALTTITGAGTFNLPAGATLINANPAGISAAGATGAVQTTTRNFNTAANYTYNGAAGSTGTGLPVAFTGGTVTSSPSSGGLALTQSTIFNNLTLTASPFTVAVGITAAINGVYTAAGSINMTGAGNFTANPGSTLVLGNTSAAGVLQPGAAGNIQVSGARTYAANVNITLAPSALATGTNMPASFGTLTLNNTSAATLSQATTVTGLVILNTGNLTTTAVNLLTVSSSSAASVVRSGTGFVNGPLARTFPVSFATPGSYLFPVGKTVYQGFELINPVVDAGGSAILQIESFASAPAGGTAGTGLTGPLSARYWQATVTGTGLFTSVSNVRLTEIVWAANQKIGQSATLGGAYDSRGGAVGGITITSTSALAAFGSGTFFALGTGSGVGTFTAGNYSIGPGPSYGGYIANYTSITAASSDIANFASLGGNIIFEFQADYVSTVESYPIVVPNMGASSGATITFRPAVSVGSVINFNPAGGLAGTPILDMNGATYTRFDGRPGGAGSNRYLSFNNLGQGPALRLINDAQNNTLTYLELRSSIVSAAQTSGIVLISTTAVGVTLANGNNNNTISFNNINGAGISPIGIYASGTAAPADNKSNTITDNNIFDYFSDNATASFRNTGIWLFVNNGISAGSTWTISNNSFYQTSTRTIALAITAASPLVLSGIEVGQTFGTASLNITGNYIGGSAALCGGSAWTQTGPGNSSNSFIGIRATLGSAVASTISGNIIQNISVNSATTSTLNAGMHIGTGLVSVTGNTIGSLTTAGSISYNQSAGASSGFTGINLGGFAGINTTITCNSNNIGGLAITGVASCVLRGIQELAATYVGNQTINSNTLGSASAPLLNATNSILNGMTLSVGTLGIVTTVAGNTINYLSGTFPGNNVQTIGIINGTTGGVYNVGTSALPNNINNLSSGCAITTAVVGIFLTTNTVGGSSITNNIIHTLQATSNFSVGVFGIIFNSLTSGTNLVSRNNIHSLTTAVPGFVNGIQANSFPLTIQNNMIRLGINPDGSNQTIPNTINGINKVSTGAVNVYHNSVYIGGSGVTSSSNITNAFLRSGTAIGDDIRDNVFVNARSNSSTGGNHYAINFATNNTVTSNYNDLYVSGTGGLIGIAGTTSYSTLALWKTGTGQDANSASADPQFITPAGTSATVNLHIHPTNPTPVEASGIDMGITDDFDGQTRSTLTPVDMGADAGNFVALDVQAPIISAITYVGTACDLTSRNVTATITDATGVDNAGFKPRIYFRKNGGAYVSAAGSLTAGTVQNGTWTFTITYALVGGVVATDVIDYFIVAQDIGGNVGGSPSFGLILTDVSTVTNNPVTPLTYTILSNTLVGTYTVGTLGTYSTLTAAVAAYNTSCLAGPVIFELLDASYTTGPTGIGEIYPIFINANAEASATNTLTIRPASTVIAALTGSVASGALIRLNGADYVTIDGSNNGTSSQDLTITNSNTTSPTAIWISSLGTGAGATNNTIKNCIINTGSNAATSYGIAIAGATLGIGGADNDNVTIQNNNVTRVFHGIWANGTASVSAGGMDVLNINNNIIGPVASGVNNIGFSGINLANAVSPSVTLNTVQNIAATSASAAGILTASTVAGATISQNTVQNLTTTTPILYGILVGGASGTFTVSRNTVSGIAASAGLNYIAGIETNVTSTIDRNNVTNISNNTTSTYGSYGINLNAGNGHIVKNNFVSGVTGDMTGGIAFSTTFGIFGIRVNAGTGHQVYHNSVNLYGARTGTPNSSLLGSAFCIVGGASTGCDVRNNIFANTMTGGTTSIAYTSMYLPSGGGPATGLTLNNNAYHTGTTAGVHGICHGGTTYTNPVVTTGVGLYSVANFIPSATTPVTNLRNYTSILGVATNDNASLASTTAVTFVSNTDLHLSTAAGANCLLDGTGAPIGTVTNDYDNDPRDVAAPDMGADEFTSVPTSTLAATAGGGQVCNNANVGTSGKIFKDASCNAIARVVPNGGSPVSGMVNTCVTIETGFVPYGGQVYVQRHFDITPATNQSTATATLTLYVLQSEFDAYNAANGSYPELPIDGADVAGNKANLRITKYSGNGTLPGTYSPGVATFIDPADANIVWDAVNSWWTITFDVTGFSGLFIHTGLGVLPVSILNFSGYKDGSRNQLRWTTSSEQNNSGFEVQRSTDGINYTALGFVNTLALGGNSTTDLNYGYTDNNVIGSRQYYRLRQVNFDGSSKFSNIVLIKGDKPVTLTIDGLFPNPARTLINVLIATPNKDKITMVITDIAGRTVIQQVVSVETGSNTIPVDISRLSNGTYLVKLVCSSNCETAVGKFVKQ